MSESTVGTAGPARKNSSPEKRGALRRRKRGGRLVTCSGCSHKTVAGTTRVMRKIVFHFCPACWIDRRRCELLMDEVSR